MAVQMNRALIRKVEGEMARGIEKWGETDTCPEVLLNAITEEVGEVAHAINHGEGLQRARQEIAEAIGVLARLYDMVEIYVAPEPVSVTLEHILLKVIDFFVVSRVELVGRRSFRHLVHARQVAMYLMRQETKCYLREIGEEMHRNLATVCYSYGKIAAEMTKDADLRLEVLRIQGSLRRKF